MTNRPAPTTGAAAAASAPAGQGEVLALVEKGAHALSFFDLRTGSRQSSVPLPSYPHEMVVDAQRRHAFIGHYGVRMSDDPGDGGAAVIVVDLHRREVINTIDTKPYNRVHGMGIDDRDRVYALSEAKAQLMTFHQPSRAKAPTSVVPTGGVKTHLFALSRDGTRAYVTGLESDTVSLINPHAPGLAPRMVRPGATPEGISLSCDQRTLFVGARKSKAIVAIDARTLAIRKIQQVDGDPARVYAPPHGGVLVTNIANNTVSMLTEDLDECWRMQFDGAPAGVSFHPTRPIAYVSQFVTNQIAVVDLRARQVLLEFATGLEPDTSVVLG